MTVAATVIASVAATATDMCTPKDHAHSLSAEQVAELYQLMDQAGFDHNDMIRAVIGTGFEASRAYQKLLDDLKGRAGK